MAPLVAFVAMVLACFVFVRRFASLGQWGWVTYSAATAITALALVAWPGQDGLSVRLVVAVALTFAWATAVATQLMTQLPSTTGPSKP